MTNYLFDTNHLSPLVSPDHYLGEQVQIKWQAGHSFAIAMPALTEFLFGISTLPRARQNLFLWQHIQDQFIFYGIDRQDAELAANLQTSLRRRGRQLLTVDALIAAVALRYDLVLLTTDRDFQTIPGLPQENWLSL